LVLPALIVLSVGAKIETFKRSPDLGWDKMFRDFGFGHSAAPNPPAFNIGPLPGRHREMGASNLSSRRSSMACKLLFSNLELAGFIEDRPRVFIEDRPRAFCSGPFFTLRIDFSYSKKPNQKKT
jgi:hypothetical protein